MTRTTNFHRADQADNVRRTLLGPLHRLFQERNSASAIAAQPSNSNASAITSLAGISLVALLMLWAVINPML